MGIMDKWIFWDKQPKRWFNKTSVQKDMVAICCFANEYWERESMRAKAYSIVGARSLLHSGAFVISGIIDKWAMLESNDATRSRSGLLLRA